MARQKGSVVEDVASLVAGAKRSAAAVVTVDAVVVGEELDKYWTLKKRMAAGAQPPRVAAMLAALKGRASRTARIFVWSGRRRVSGGRDEGG